MKNKSKIILTAATLAILSLTITTYHWQPPIPRNQSDCRSVSVLIENSRDNTPPTESQAVVADVSPEISTQNLPQDNTCTKTDFEPKISADSRKFLTESSTPRDNPTTTPVPSKNKTEATACEPKMGDTRTVDGQKQVYFLGFGWIDDNDEPNECIYVEDMYENGNKIGSMGGGTFADGDGDINKMVGRMD